MPTTRSSSGELALGAGSDLDTLLTALAHFRVPPQRTCELRDLVARSTSADDGQLLALLADQTRRQVTETLRDPRRLDVELVDRLAASRDMPGQHLRCVGVCDRRVGDGAQRPVQRRVCNDSYAPTDSPSSTDAA